MAVVPSTASAASVLRAPTCRPYAPGRARHDRRRRGVAAGRRPRARSTSRCSAARRRRPVGVQDRLRRARSRHRRRRHRDRHRRGHPPLHAPRPRQRHRHLDRLGRRLRPDRLDAPGQHDDAADDELAQRPGHRPADRATDAAARPCTPSGASTATRAGRPATRPPSPAPAPTSSRPPRSTPPATAPSASRHGPDRQHAPGRHHDRPRRLAERRRRRPGHRHRRRLRRRPRRVAARRAAAAAPAPTARSSASARTASHNFTHARRRRGRQRDRVDRRTPSMVDIAGPGRHDRRPERLDHRPVDRSSTSPPTTTAAPASSASSGELDGTTSGDVLGADTDARDGHRRRRPQARGADHRRPATASTTGTRTRSRSTRSTRSTTRPSRPAGSRSTYARRARARHRPHSQVQGVEWRLDGGDVLSASSNNHEVRVAGNGVHTLETRIVDNAGRTQRLEGRTRSSSTRRCRPTRTPAAPTRLAQHALLGRAQRHRRRLRRGLGALARSSSRASPRATSTTARAASTPRRDRPTTARTRSSTRVRDIAGNFSAWRAETIRIDRVAADRRHGLSVGARRQPPRRHLRPAGRPLGRRRRSSGSSTTASSRPRRRRRSPAPARTRSSRPRAGQRRQLERLGATTRSRSSSALDTTAPTDTTVDPDAVAARRLHGDRRPPTDDIDGTGVDYVEWRYGGQPDRPGPRRQPVHDHRPTASTRSRRARSTRPATRPPWRRQTLRLDTTQPTETTALPSRLDERATRSRCSATDATSGIAEPRVQDRQRRAPITAANGTTVTLPGDGNYRSATARSTTPASRRAGRSTTFRSTPSLPANTSAAAPTTWQTTRAVAAR